MATMYEDAAATGAMTFDLLEPGWVRDIDLNTLDQEDPKACVGQQVFGSFHRALEVVKRHGGAEANGLIIQSGVPDLYRTIHYGYLTDRWISEIKQRLRSGSMVPLTRDSEAVGVG